MTNVSKIYYVDSMRGNDENDGLSMVHPFASLFRINNLQLKPGDKVLLANDSVFNNQYLQIRACGTKEQPIMIGAYQAQMEEEGRYPLIAANGQGIWYQDYGTLLDSSTHVYQGYVSSAILLYDAEHIIIQDIEITNHAGDVIGETYSAPHKMNRTGVAVVAKDKGLRSGITLRNLSIHDVNGNVYDKHMNNGGIYMTALKPANEEETGVSHFSDITVENCFVYRVSRWGIAVGYTHAHEKFQGVELKDTTFFAYGHQNVLIRNNYVKAAGGDGITAMYALRPLVEHNMTDSVACEMNDRIYQKPENRAGKVAAAIWPWKCKDAIFRYNEAVDTRLNQDGMAYDADSGDGTVYEYNYSRANEGGCIMFCLQEAVHNTFRYNVSYDDLGGIVSPAENPDALLSHNTFYIRKDVPFIRKNMDGGTITEVDNDVIEL